MRNGTYSIVARDPLTGELGVAVQSHWFSVGSVVAWARPGVGAVATQSVAEVAHGPNALQRMHDGLDSAEAIQAVLRDDELARLRQLGAVDAAGLAAAHTGEGCIEHAGDELGDGFSCQANMMADAGVPQAMAAGFRAHSGDLADRLLAALDAGEAAGGDVRGRQSAALLVVPASGESWRVRFDVRVDDHSDPLGELRRLVRLARAYELGELRRRAPRRGGPRRGDEALPPGRRARPGVRRAGLLGRPRRRRAGPAGGRRARANGRSRSSPRGACSSSACPPELSPTAAAVKEALAS